MRNQTRHGARKNIFFTLLAAALLLFSTIGTTQAAWKATGESVHEISLENIRAQIVEEYETASDVHPGGTVDKVVNVKNTGNSDCVVRVKAEESWGEIREEDGKLIADASYATDNIIIGYNTTYWVYDASDGYFYYKGVLAPGETTLEPLFDEFSITKETGNEYQGLHADILVKMECIQAAADGISVWGKSFKDLGIDYAPAQPGETAYVTFVGGDEEFVFDPDTTDLFGNFKHLMPGETRSQAIVVTNEFEIATGVEIFLRAEDINQSFSDDPETLALINKLLQEYATIVITDDSGTVLYSGPVWGEPYREGAAPGTMKNDISLGMFATGESKSLNIQLQLDSAADNEYQSLLGLIKWVWTAQDTDYETVTIDGSKTWYHGANPVTQRPEEIIIHVKANGDVIAVESVTAEDHWKWSFTLPKYDKYGDEIAYTIDEEPIPGYETEVDGYDVTNKHETHEDFVLSGTKTWDHGGNTGKRPASIVIHIKQDNEVIISERITEEDGWKWAFDLPKYDENGKEIQYIVEEDNVENYTLERKDGYNLHNRFVSPDYPGDGKPSTPTPKTGDTMKLWIWGGAMLLSAAALAVLLLMGRRNKSETAE